MVLIQAAQLAKQVDVSVRGLRRPAQIALLSRKPVMFPHANWIESAKRKQFADRRQDAIVMAFCESNFWPARQRAISAI